MYVPFSNLSKTQYNERNFILEARNQFMLCMDRFILTVNSETLPTADIGSLKLQFELADGVASMILSDSRSLDDA